MKKNVYLSLLAIGVVAVGGMVFSNTDAHERTYQPLVEEADAPQTSMGSWEYMNSLRANQHTGVVDPEDVARAKKEIALYDRSHGKADFPLTWTFAGPDNIGGRTRGFMIDRNNNSVLYAGGVMGGIFKSTNKGASWRPVDDQLEDMSISSICQTVDGTIYFGTGESFTGNAGQEAATPGWRGGGIYKSTDNGSTFEKITSTAGYTYVNKVVAHPTKNIVFACTNTGLRASTENNDNQWNLIQAGNARDFVIDKNGNALAFVNSAVYRSTDPATTGSFSAVSGLPVTGVNRIALAVSESDANYAYAVVVGTSYFTGPTADVWSNASLMGIYQSKDNGANFEEIVGRASSFFSPFTIPTLVTSGNTRTFDGKVYNYCHSQGYYDICIGVHPNDREHIYVGGVDFVEWTPEAGPKIVGSTNDHKANPYGIHADKHLIAFDTKSNPIIMYVTSDGGVAKTTNADLNRYTSLYNGYAATQFYGIAAGTNGIIVGGTQDNNSIVIDGNGNTPQAGVDVIGGDGFQCEVSTINPDIIFVESQNGMMGRSLNAGGNVSSIWDDRIKDDMVSVRSDGVVRQANSIFNTPIQLWEDLEDSSSRMYYALNDGIWMALDAVTAPSPNWYRVAEVGFFPHMMQVTKDGEALFVSGTSSSTLSRIDGLNNVEWDTAVLHGNTVSDSLTITNINSNLPGGRSVTDIEVDQSNPNRVIVTLGNYGNSSYIYITENALDPVPTWRSIQGSMPSLPIYDAEISVDDPDVIILGTEFGVYYTQNGSASTPTWTPNTGALPRVPVLQMRQVEERVWKDGSRTGAVLYAGTHGRGIWKSSSLLTGIKPVAKNVGLKLNAYPNPSRNNLTIDMPVSGRDEVKVVIMNYAGQELRSKLVEVAGTNASINLDVTTLPAGNYLVSVQGNLHKGATKFVKID